MAVYNSGFAQYLAAFNDNADQFWAFEAGMYNPLEDSKVEDFQVGGTLIAYLDDASNFKIYQFGEVKTLMKVAPVEFTATDYLLGYSLIDNLYVYDQDRVQQLTNDCKKYIVMDSIIVWQTKSTDLLQVYYKGNVNTILEDVPDFRLKSYMVGDNLFAFINPDTEEFNVYYRGELNTFEIETTERNYQAGCDILAYTDFTDQSFNVYYKGEKIQLELFQPQSFKVGDEMLAFIDNQGDLQFFENGKIQYITSTPEVYEVKDHVLVYEDQGSFKTICNGQVYIVEQYIPQPYYIDNNTLAYLFQNEWVKVFQHCEHISVRSADVKSFSMVRDVIVYSEVEEEVKVYFNGQVYEHVNND